MTGGIKRKQNQAQQWTGLIKAGCLFIRNALGGLYFVFIKYTLVYGMRTQAFKNKTQPGKIIQHFGQDIIEVAFGFQAVVKYNYAAFRGMVGYVPEALFFGDFLIKIPAQDIPHNDTVMPLQKLDLGWF